MEMQEIILPCANHGPRQEFIGTGMPLLHEGVIPKSLSLKKQTLMRPMPLSRIIRPPDMAFSQLHTKVTLFKPHFP